jgi:CO dehydrogenase maturation factor
VKQVVVVDVDESNPGIERMLGLNEPTPSLIDAVGGRKQVFGSIKGTSSAMVRKKIKLFIEEARGKDLLLIRVGKIDEAGSGCACPHGAISREILAYPFTHGTLVLVDCEAGIEHFGRGLDANVDTILFIVDPSYNTVELCQEAKRLADSIGVEFIPVLNKVQNEEVTDFVRAELSKRAVNVRFVIPYDDRLFMSVLHGDPLEVSAVRDNMTRLVNELLE